MTRRRTLFTWATVTIIIWTGAIRCVSDTTIVPTPDTGADTNAPPDTSTTTDTGGQDVGSDAIVDAGFDAPCISTPDGGKAGALDLSFKNGNIGGVDPGFELFGAAIDPLDRIYLVGRANCGKPLSDMAMYRLNASGTLDTSFGAVDGGKLCWDYGGGDNVAYAVATNLTGDSGIVVAAGASTNVDSGFFPGSMLASWDGVTSKSIAPTKNGGFWAIDMAPGDKTVAVGFLSGPGIYATRRNADISTDNTFSHNYSNAPAFDTLNAVAVDPKTNEIMVTASTAKGDLGVLHYPATGTNPNPLSKFVTTGNPGATFRGIIIRPQGKGFFVVGPTGPDASAAQIMAVTDDGGLDTTFNATGSMTINQVMPDTYFTGRPTYMQCDGKIIVAGGGTASSVVARVNPNGGLDTTFGTGGVAGAPSIYTIPVAVFPDSQGRIVVVGRHATIGTFITLYRLLP